MQTFLPYPDFAASAAVLDQARLGKQRVETLQILRALVIPDYGWRRHPAVLMWSGYVPALTLYGLAMVAEWVGRGHEDGTQANILEFAPGVLDDGDIPMPPWLGDHEFHRGHQSNLILKSPAFYQARFPGVDGGLPYVWPEPAEHTPPHDPEAGSRLWICSSGTGTARAPAPTPGGQPRELTMPAAAPGKRPSPKWRRQLEAFTAVAVEGDPVAVPDAGGQRFSTGTLGKLRIDDDGVAHRSVRLTGKLHRHDFDYPALLQDPRTFFAVPSPAAPGVT
ncbi:MAG TPA: MSMEG_6728 family protein [Arthrobacter sp.]|nr:MSMEG_6728 family protein [Arthrobacter sp.]